MLKIDARQVIQLLQCADSDNWDGAVHQHRDGTWWWIDETGCDEMGPYTHKSLASIAVRLYAAIELGEPGLTPVMVQDQVGVQLGGLLLAPNGPKMVAMGRLCNGQAR